MCVAVLLFSTLALFGLVSLLFCHHSTRFYESCYVTPANVSSKFERLNPYAPKSDQCQISSLSGNRKSHSMNLAFHSLLKWKVIILPILTTSLIRLPSKGLEIETFWACDWYGVTSPPKFRFTIQHSTLQFNIQLCHPTGLINAHLASFQRPG